MRKVLFLTLTLALMLVSCKKAGMNFTEQGPVNMTQGETKTLSVQFSDSKVTGDVQFTVSDENVVKIVSTTGTSCEVVARGVGSCVVTATYPEGNLTATITINVAEKGYKFRMFYGWSMVGEHYAVYVQRKKGRYDDGTMVVDDSKRFPDDGTWLYRYIDDNEDTIGVFKDSVMTVMHYALPEELVFNGTVDLEGTPAPILALTLSFRFLPGAWLIMGDYTIVDDATATDTIRQEGVAAQMMPGYAQVTKFDQNNYFTYMADFLEGKADPLSGDQNMWLEYHIHRFGDSRVIWYNPGNENKTTFKGLINGGSFYFDFSEDYTSEVLSYYDIDVTLYDNEDYYCLRTEVNAETGKEEIVKPFQMAGSHNTTFKGGEKKAAPSKEMAVPANAMETRMNVNHTMFAVMASALR